jgi:exopolysaccharide biosynthesis WecB/TagA/CpsF family protein
MSHTNLLNISLDNLTQADLLDNLKKGILLPINVDLMVKLQKDREFYEIVRKAEWVVCDSKILYLCSKLTKQPLKTYIPGSSLFPAFCDYHKDDENCKIFLLGAMDGVALKAQEKINERIGRNIIVGAYSPSYGFEKKDEENEQIVNMINESNANVVLVGVGCPKQEKWIYIKIIS